MRTRFIATILLLISHLGIALELDPNRNKPEFILGSTKSKATEIIGHYYVILEEWPETKNLVELKNSWNQLYRSWKESPDVCHQENQFCPELHQAYERFSKQFAITKGNIKKKEIADILDKSVTYWTGHHNQLSVLSTSPIGAINIKQWGEDLEKADELIIAAISLSIPNEYRNVLKQGLHFFIRPLEKYLVRHSNYQFFYPQVEDLNWQINELHVALTKRALKISPQNTSELNYIHQVWNEILKSYLKF